MNRSSPTAVEVEGAVRHRVTLTSDPCVPDTDLSRHFQREMIRWMSEVPDLSLCGPVPFQKMAMRHDGDRWVIDLEATVRLTDPARS